MEDIKKKINNRKIHKWMEWLKYDTYVRKTLAILKETKCETIYTVTQIYTVRKGYSQNVDILKAMKKVAAQEKVDYDFIHKPLD